MKGMYVRLLRLAPVLLLVLAMACSDDDASDFNPAVEDLTGSSDDRENPFEDGFDRIGEDPDEGSGGGLNIFP